MSVTAAAPGMQAPTATSAQRTATTIHPARIARQRPRAAARGSAPQPAHAFAMPSIRALTAASVPLTATTTPPVNFVKLR